MNNLVPQSNTIAPIRPLAGVFQQTINQRSMPEIGRLGLGIKSKSEKGLFPKDVDYFVLRDQEGPYSKRFRETYGDKPKSIDIFFMDEDITQFYDQAFRLWGGNGRLKCISYDGQNAVQVNEKGMRSEVSCPQSSIINGLEPDCECKLRLNDKGVPVCKLQLRFSFCLTKVAPLDGVFSLYTGSRVGQSDLFTDLNHIHMILGGKLAHVPLVLYRMEKKIRQPNSDKMAIHWPLRLRLADEVSEALTAHFNEGLNFRLGRIVSSKLAVSATQAIAQPQNEPMAQIAGPVEVVEAEASVIDVRTVNYTEKIISAMTANKEAFMDRGASEKESSEMVLIKFCSYLADTFQITIAKVEDIAMLDSVIQSTIADEIELALQAGVFPWSNH